ncbi:ATP-grasp domain-containing protein [Actinokineospora sp. G85]|uniref:ATP-grasp domain-containing protein n=1 Tax=Actinokineospora sp. G85 TaxID=3406626 RepID=UPI003C7451AE
MVTTFGAGLRPTFVRQLSAAAAELGLAVEWLSDHWIARVRRDGVTKTVIGYAFPLNLASASQLASDKAGASTVLAAAGVPVFGHELFRFQGVERERWSEVVGGMGLPLVLKPHMESGGIDVVRVASVDELDEALEFLAGKYRAIAVSPYREIEDEYRVVVLDGEVLLTYRKVRAEGGDWRHNLRLGAAPGVVAEGGFRDGLAALAQRATEVLGLRFCTVDIATVGGVAEVLEVNSSVTLERFAQSSPENEGLAHGVYRSALSAAF